MEEWKIHVVPPNLHSWRRHWYDSAVAETMTGVTGVLQIFHNSDYIGIPNHSNVTVESLPLK